MTTAALRLQLLGRAAGLAVVFVSCQHHQESSPPAVIQTHSQFRRQRNAPKGYGRCRLHQDFCEVLLNLSAVRPYLINPVSSGTTEDVNRRFRKALLS